MTDIVLITGITGQDGSYLTELLLAKGYEVHGIVRRTSSNNTQRVECLKNKITLHYGDLSDSNTISGIINQVSPTEVYNLAAQSQVDTSFEIPEYTGDITGLGTVRILEAIRSNGEDIKFYQASTSEMFGNQPAPQNESTPFDPRSPYACAKAYAHYVTKCYRESYGMYAVSSILYNHESPRRGTNFVTRKITSGLAAILAGKQTDLKLGNLGTMRDWGYAPEYVEAIWQIMHLQKPDDFVVGTGETHRINEFVFEAFSYAGLDPFQYIVTDKSCMRPSDVNLLKADITKASNVFYWNPKIHFKELVRIMVDSDMKLAGLNVIGEGNRILNRVFPNRWWID
jgi:GDPmannose 4,6-dehydratase